MMGLRDIKGTWLNCNFQTVNVKLKPSEPEKMKLKQNMQFHLWPLEASSKGEPIPTDVWQTAAPP